MTECEKPDIENSGIWNAYCEEPAIRGDAAEVRRRLAECPDWMRERVRNHCRTAWLMARRRGD